MCFGISLVCIFCRNLLETFTVIISTLKEDFLVKWIFKFGISIRFIYK